MLVIRGRSGAVPVSRCLVVCWLVCIGLGWSGDASDSEGHRRAIDAVVRAIHGRRDRAGAARYVLNGQTTYARGSCNEYYVMEPHPDPRAVLPAQETTVDFRFVFMFGQGNMRWEIDTKLWNSSYHEFRPFRRVEGCVKGVRTRHYPLSRSGVIGWANQSETKPRIYPILFAHGVLAGVEREVARSVPRKLRDPSVDPGELLLLEIIRENGTFRRMWLSPAKEYSLVRHVYGTDGKPVLDLRIDYAREEQVGWVPSHWEYSWIRNGEATQRTVVDVQERSFGLNLPEKAFRVTLPIGTRVEDRITKMTYVVGGGSPSRSTQDKAIDNLVEPLRGDTGQERQGRAARQTPIVSRRNVVVLGVTLALAGVIVLYLRRRAVTRGLPK